MADQLYLSLWFPNFRLEGLPVALTGVLRQFAAVAGDGRVRAASAYPIDFTESPTYQRIFVTDERAAETADTAASQIEYAVAEATEQMHDDMAYEFEMAWNLWLPDPARASDPKPRRSEMEGDEEELEERQDSFEHVRPHTSTPTIPFPLRPGTGAESLWKRRLSTVRILGFGPEFDTAGYAQNGHIRVNFGLDTPWTMETAFEGSDAPAPGQPELAAETARHIQQNVEMLLAFTLLVEKQCGISSRLLWTESGEPLAEKLVASLQRLH